jgi:parvulin-like peptidyl-prolyl isomerase
MGPFHVGGLARHPNRGVAMSPRRLPILPVASALLVLLAPVSACRSGKNFTVTPRNTVLKVNGVPISELEVALETHRGHGSSNATESREEVLDNLILKEAMAQKAVALGLDNDEGFQERMARIEAQRASQRRKELARLFHQHEVLDQVTATEQEARAAYDASQARIRTELHVAQIFTRDEAEAARAFKDLRDGRSFDEVAARGYPDLPPGMKPPWDLGFLRWKSVPLEWQPALAGLPPGQITGIIRGPGRRFWIVKLLEKRDNPELTFERTKADLVAELKARKAEALRVRIEQELRRAAKVEKVRSSSLALPARKPGAVPALRVRGGEHAAPPAIGRGDS